jgi:PAS domain S-box-containing protein
MKIWTKFISSSALLAGVVAILLGGSSFLLRRVDQSLTVSRDRASETANLSLQLEAYLQDPTLALKDFLLLNRNALDMAAYQKAVSNFLLTLDELETISPNSALLDLIRRRHQYLVRIADSLTSDTASIEQSQQDLRAINSFSTDIEFHVNELINETQQDYELAVQDAQGFRYLSTTITRLIIILVLVAFIIQFILILLPVIRAIEKLQLGVTTISQGNLDYRLDINTKDEIEALANQFNSMAGKLAESYQTLEQKVTHRTAELTKVNENLKTEIAERQEAQKVQVRLTAILEATTDFVGIANPDGKPIYINQAGRKMLGISPDDNLDDFHVNKITEASSRNLIFNEAFPTAIQTGLWNGEARLQHSRVQERKIPVSQLIMAHKSEDGNLEYLSTIARDITEIKEKETALLASEKQLRQQAVQLQDTLKDLQDTQAQLIQTEKMSSLGQLVAGIAHEINNPVNFIYGNLSHADEYINGLLELVELYTQTYSQPRLEIEEKIAEIELDYIIEDLPKVLNSMKVGSERIREIVLSLRTFSRLDESQMKSADIHAGIESTLLILQNRLKAKPGNPKIEIIKEYGNLPELQCYPGQLNQAFMNILSNAIDILDERNQQLSPLEIAEHPATIVIKTQQSDPQVVAISIKDNGKGMTEAVKQKLFNPFFTTKPVGKGTGLGLAICYQIIVDKHRGHLHCNSEVGEGTEFIIEIPIRQDFSVSSNQ